MNILIYLQLYEPKEYLISEEERNTCLPTLSLDCLSDSAEVFIVHEKENNFFQVQDNVL